MKLLIKSAIFDSVYSGWWRAWRARCLSPFAWCVFVHFLCSFILSTLLTIYSYIWLWLLFYHASTCTAHLSLYAHDYVLLLFALLSTAFLSAPSLFLRAFQMINFFVVPSGFFPSYFHLLLLPFFISSHHIFLLLIFVFRFQFVEHRIHWDFPLYLFARFIYTHHQINNFILNSTECGSIHIRIYYLDIFKFIHSYLTWLFILRCLNRVLFLSFVYISARYRLSILIEGRNKARNKMHFEMYTWSALVSPRLQTLGCWWYDYHQNHGI